jgi:hypothetical protein
MGRGALHASNPEEKPTTLHPSARREEEEKSKKDEEF